MNNKTYRQVSQIHNAPSPHWVGDGFHVNPMFNHMVADKRTDPFLMLDYASPQYFAPNQAEPRGVGQHPHKGFETVTIAYMGEVTHRDSSGGGGTIGTGDVQWMTAGNGVIHEEFHSKTFSETGGDFEMVQLWINLPTKDKGTPAKYQHLANADIPVVALQNDTHENVGKARLIAGEFTQQTQQTQAKTTQGLGTTFTPINLWDIQLNAHAQVELAIPRTHNLLVLVRQGSVGINQAQYQAHACELVCFETEKGGQGVDYVRFITADNSVELLLMSGVPLNEPIVGYGPFVMNTEQEIHQAIMDFNAGKFGQVA
ncbi:pirin family protein [Moraxella boevrei]|uniref:pirin family protein n=1 Tax=Faucicola boevrei TaxID=346665 RepID=UPI003735F20B